MNHNIIIRSSAFLGHTLKTQSSQTLRSLVALLATAFPLFVIMLFLFFLVSVFTSSSTRLLTSPLLLPVARHYASDRQRRSERFSFADMSSSSPRSNRIRHSPRFMQWEKLYSAGQVVHPGSSTDFLQNS